MKRLSILLAPIAIVAAATPVLAQSQVKVVAVDPTDADIVWTLNRDNNSVSVVDTSTGTLLSEINVGVWPRSLAFDSTGTKLLVVNQRGNVPVTTNFVTPFNGTEVRGSVSVIDRATKTVVNTLTNVGTEPYGIALAPNGKYFAISAQRSGEMIMLDSTTLTEVERFEYLWDMNFIPGGSTIADVDADFDGIPDLWTPRGFALSADSTKIYVTHFRSSYVSVLDVTLNGSGVPTAVALDAKIQQNEYPFHPINNPVHVQNIASQGLPRFSVDIALSPDGTQALVPSQLTNVNHDVNHNFGPGLAGAFANRVYPALSILDITNASYGQPGDRSGRLHHELADDATPAEYVPFGPNNSFSMNGTTSTGIATLGGIDSPVIGGTLRVRLSGVPTGSAVVCWFGPELPVPLAVPGFLSGSQLVGVTGAIALSNLGGGLWGGNVPIANNPLLDGTVVALQAAILEPGQPIAVSNGLRAVIGTAGYELNKMGRRGALPSKALFNPAGDRVLMMNRGSEDVFLYSYSAGRMKLLATFPPRHGFTERAPFDTTTPMGDMPLGWTIQADASTSNDDALIYVQNEASRSLSVLRVDWKTGVFSQVRNQIATHTGPDLMTASERMGQEIFEDGSRTQTTGGFNNSCASCHYEGGEDGNVWQRPAGPRSTMPVYGGPALTGLLLWKGTRISVAETGPMFGGENGGHGIFTDTEQQSITDYSKVIPVPLNPNFDPLTNDLTADAAIGADLFHGRNDTGTNPTQRRAGCAVCHPDQDGVSGNPRGYTADFLNPLLTNGLDFGFVFDQNCFSLQENVASIGLRNVNSGVNVDEDGDMIVDLDRNFDGYPDLETYTPLNVDADDPFTRDDPNSYPCLDDPFDPMSPPKDFDRAEQLFSIPTKLGVLSSGPYMHDHSLVSLRTLLDPDAQMNDPVYGNAAYPGTLKWFNEFHDMRGHENFVPGVSKVKLGLNPVNVNDDIEKVLAFIASL